MLQGIAIGGLAIGAVALWFGYGVQKAARPTTAAAARLPGQMMGLGAALVVISVVLLIGQS